MSRAPRAAALAAALGAALAASLPAALAGADSFTPVQLGITVAQIARLGQSLPVTVRVSADPGALDNHSGPIRIQVKLAPECGATYQYTPGPVLLDAQLSPQPATGHAYSASAHGSGKPGAYGVQTVCAWLNDGQDRTWASEQSIQVDVSRACTTAAARYDAARRHRRKQAAADRRAARRACGPGVTL